MTTQESVDLVRAMVADAQGQLALARDPVGRARIAARLAADSSDAAEAFRGAEAAAMRELVRTIASALQWGTR